jgi:rubrerythrin
VSEKILKNIAHAFAEESKASVKYGAFGLKAEKEGYPKLARLFRAVADAKSIHSRRFLYLMRGKVGTTHENLKNAFRNEMNAKENDYPDRALEAKKGSKAVKKAFVQSMQTDGEFAELFRNALEEIHGREDAPLYVCQICGHIHLGSIPENCPVCHAVPGRFRLIN